MRNHGKDNAEFLAKEVAMIIKSAMADDTHLFVRANELYVHVNYEYYGEKHIAECNTGIRV